METDFWSVPIRSGDGHRDSVRDSIERGAVLLACDLCGGGVCNRARPDRAFLHGLLVGIVNSVWITCAHVVFFDQYIAKHAQEAAVLKSIPASQRVMMAVIGPMVGVISGIVIGVVALLMVKALKTPTRKSA